MDCETCNHLLATYKDTVRVFKDSARRSSTTARAGSRLAAQDAAFLFENCKEASDALMAHWREHHSYFGDGPGSST